MIIIIQTIILIAALFIILVALSSRRSYAGRAWKKIGLVFLGVAMIVAVLSPDITNGIARFVGIGRGADLLLYGLIIAFILSSLNSYLQQQDERDRTVRLARKIALLEASERYFDSKVSSKRLDS